MHHNSSTSECATFGGEPELLVAVHSSSSLFSYQCIWHGCRALAGSWHSMYSPTYILYYIPHSVFRGDWPPPLHALPLEEIDALAAISMTPLILKQLPPHSTVSGNLLWMGHAGQVKVNGTYSGKFVSYQMHNLYMYAVMSIFIPFS